MGAGLMAGRTRVTRADDEEDLGILRDYVKGVGPAELARRLGVSRSTVVARIARIRADDIAWSGEDEGYVRGCYDLGCAHG